MTKVCFKCRAEKPIGEFYRHPKMADGHLGKCKECTKSDVKARYELTRHDRSRYERERQQQPERRAAKTVYGRRHRQVHPDKYRARQAVNWAVRSGRLVRQPCAYCGGPNAQAHHEDYSRPLDIVWACFKCHRECGHGQVVVSERGVGDTF